MSHGMSRPVQQVIDYCMSQKWVITNQSMSHIMTHVKSKYESYVQKKNMSHVPFENKRSWKEKHMQNEKDMKKDKNRNNMY